MKKPPAESFGSLHGSYARALRLGPAWMIVTDEEMMFILPARLFRSQSRAVAEALDRLAAMVDDAPVLAGPAREAAQAELYDVLVRTYLDLLEGALPAKPAGAAKPKPARRTSGRKGKTR